LGLGLKVEREISRLIKEIPDPPRIAPHLNKLIDQHLHPKTKEPEGELVYLIDWMLHTAVEVADTFVASVHKGVKYNLSKMLEGGK